MQSLKTLITAEEAITLIANNKLLTNCHIEGRLNLNKINNGQVNGLVLDNCYVEDLASAGVQFANPVKFTKTQICKSVFHGAYFLEGLIMDDCIFEFYLDFEVSGHNSPGTSFVINNCVLHGFVNFLDAWFQGDVLVTNNSFKKGTNLLGNKGTPLEASFDFKPTISNNSGRIDEDGDGGKPVNYINLL
jgi:hypothetical protein